MSRKIMNAICSTFPGAEMSDPWGGGHDAWKVGGTDAFIAPRGDKNAPVTAK
jgi:hypothetical protein